MLLRLTVLLAVLSVATLPLNSVARLRPIVASADVQPAAGGSSAVYVPAALLSFPATAPTIAIQLFSFRPSVVTVTVGSIVLWTERDGREGETRGLHNVVSTTGAWTAVPCTLPTDPCLHYGETFSVTVTTPGSYAFFCDPHPFMRGTIVVIPAASNQQTASRAGSR